MRALRIGIHLLVSSIIFLLFALTFRDLFREGITKDWFLCVSTLVLSFAGCLGLILELRRNRTAAFLNPAIPFAFAVLLIVDALLAAEPEGAGYVMLFSLIPFSVSAVQGVLYYMAWQSGWFQE